MCDSIRKAADPRRPHLGHYHLALTAVILGLWAAAVPAQTLPAGGAVTTTAPASQPSQPVPEAAIKAIESKRWADAVTILEPLAKPESAGFDVLVKLAGCYDALARDLLTKKPTAEPGKTDEDLRKERDARDKAYNEACKKAVEHYLQAANLAQVSTDPLIQRRTESILVHVLQLKPNNPSALLLLAREYENVNPAIAITYYRDYVKTEDGAGDAPSKIALGRLLVAQQYWRQAVELLDDPKFKNAVENSRAGAEADQELALAYLVGKRQDKAVEAAERAINNSQHTAEAFIVHGYVCLQTGDRAKAMDDALKAVQLARKMIIARPSDEALWAKLADWQSRLWQIAQAVQAQPQSRPGPTKPDYAIQIQLAQLISDVGDLIRLLYDHEAVTVLNAAAKADDAPTDLLVALAQRQRDLGQAELADKTADRILSRDPANAIAKAIKETVAKKIKETGGKSETKPAG